METTLTPETDGEAFYETPFGDAMYVKDGPKVSADFARKLERERDEARKAITDLTQRLQERQESFQAQLIRIEDTWREKLVESKRQSMALHAALDDAISLIDRCSINETPGDFHVTFTAVKHILATSNP